MTIFNIFLFFFVSMLAVSEGFTQKCVKNAKPYLAGIFYDFHVHVYYSHRFFFRFLGSSLHPLSSSLPSNISAIRLYFCRPLFWRIHCVQIIATWINYPWLGVIVVYNYKSTIYPFVWLGLHSIPTNWNDFGSYCFSAIFLSLTATSTVKVK